MNKKNLIIGILGLGAAFAFIGICMFLFSGSDKTYKVSFNSDGGTAVSAVEVKSGEKVTKPADPTKEGYIFLRWELDGREFNFNSKITKDLTLKAIYEIEATKYKVTLIVEGQEPKELNLSTLTENSLLGVAEDKEGYEIKWYQNDVLYDFTKALEGDITLTGKYVKVETYTIKFDSDGGSKVEDQQIKPNGLVNEPTKPTKEAFVFDGWYLNGVKYDFSTPVTKSITLKAKWSEDPNVKRYEVTFNSDGGNNVASQRIIANKTATEPAAPKKDGYTFLGWYLNDTKFNFNTPITKNTALKAKWKEVIKYTVTFNSNGGSNVASQQVVEGEKVTRPNDPTRSGFTFAGWTLAGNPYDFNKAVTGPIELIATWKENFTVTFDSNGGSSVQPQTVASGNKATKPADPQLASHKFMGWLLNGQPYDFNTPVTGSITLTASWEEIANYTIRATKVDEFSPDSRLTVYKNGTQITVKEIKYNDGVHLCNGNNPTVLTADLAGETSFKVVLTDDKVVTATLVS